MPGTDGYDACEDANGNPLATGPGSAWSKRDVFED